MAERSIQAAMPRLCLALILLAGCVQAQTAAPATPLAAPPVTPATTANDAVPRRSVGVADASSEPIPGKVGLVRGVVKRLDSIHDRLLIHAFGGGDIRIAFDPRTHLLPDNASISLTNVPAGTVVSVDTVIDGGKLFARSVRTGPSDAAEVNGRVVRYDAAKSRLILRDPLDPGNVALRISPSTTVVNRGQPASPDTLSPGMLVQVSFSPTENAAKNVEILAEPGNVFIFEGRIVAVDLRAGVLALSNDSDQSIRELAIGSLDASSLGLLREEADVSIQAEFDGDRYNARTVTLVPRPQ